MNECNFAYIFSCHMNLYSLKGKSWVTSYTMHIRANEKDEMRLWVAICIFGRKFYIYIFVAIFSAYYSSKIHLFSLLFFVY